MPSMKFLRSPPIFILLTMYGVSSVYAEQLPKWEAGLGIVTINLPDYRGADERNTYVLPLPYLIYRGKLIRADREGIRGILLANEHIALKLSINGTLPVSAANNKARRGMEDLRPTIEIGPTLDSTVWRSHDGQSEIDLRLPVRASVALTSSLDHIGWLAFPNLHLKIRSPVGMEGWNMGLTGGSYISDRQYNAYFYSVAPAYATVERPAYDARGGYSGSQITWTMSKRHSYYWMGWFVRYDMLRGASFENSPLVKKRDNISVGFAISWILKRSAVHVADQE